MPEYLGVQECRSFAIVTSQMLAAAGTATRRHEVASSFVPLFCFVKVCRLLVEVTTGGQEAYATSCPWVKLIHGQLPSGCLRLDIFITPDGI
jgi:hypothetical protein